MYRNKGLNAIKIILNDKESKFLENLIHEQCDNQEEYILIIQEMMNLYRNKKSIDDIIQLVQQKNICFIQMNMIIIVKN